jgi:predicted Zn-dependent protease
MASIDLPRTESPSIAVANLDSRIAGLQERLARRFDGSTAASAIDLLMTRARFLGAMDDYSAADELAARWLRDAPRDPAAHVAAAEVAATLHRFDEAGRLLARARELGLTRRAGLALDAALAEARGDRAAALVLREQKIASRRTDPFARGAAAALRGELGDLAASERAFRAALDEYRGTSPFAVAWLCLQWGHTRERAGDVTGARSLYRAGLARLPGHVDLALHLADLELKAGSVDAAHQALAPLTYRTDHPQVLGTAANLAFLRGDRDGAAQLERRAARSAAALATRYPGAFGPDAHARTTGTGLGAGIR